METPLASFCAPIKVETNKLKYEAISRNSDETMLKSHGFKNTLMFSLAYQKDASCKDVILCRIKSTKAHFISSLKENIRFV